MALDTTVEDADGKAQEAAADGLEFEITDSTSPEQLERERQLLSEPPAVSGEAELQPNPDTTTDPAPDLPRTYSQTEVSKMQAAWARQIARAQHDSMRSAEQLKQFSMDAAVEALMQRQSGREPRSTENTTLARQALQDRQRLADSEVERRRGLEQQEIQAKYVVAHAFAREFGVGTDDFALLSNASTPTAMRDLARRLGTGSANNTLDRVPPETTETALENGYQTGPAPESGDQKLARIRQKPAWEWSEADVRYMKTGDVR